MNSSLGFRLFTLAKKVGMMSEGYAWVISDSLTNFLNSMDSGTRDSMEGVMGVRSYVQFSEGLKNFQERWKRISMSQKKNSGAIMDLNVYWLWAYDTVTALAIAAEKIGPAKSSSLYVKTANNGTRNTKLRISSFGPRLLGELSSTKFRGLSGDFQLVDRKLKPSAFEILNLIRTGERRVGFWTSDRGITRELNSSCEAIYSASTKELKNVVWPGDSVLRLKGWAIPPTGSLRVGVPWSLGFKEFVNVMINPVINDTNVTGFAIDIFSAALKVLPFPINYTFHCYNDTTCTNWSYDSMLHLIPQNYDMVVADTTIWAPRASYVDFSLPYFESGIILVVKNDKALDMWIFTKPLRWDLWLVIAAACVFMGIVIWILERQAPNPARGEEPFRRRNEQLGIPYFAPVAALVFQDRAIVSNNWSVFVLVYWLSMAFILMQSFTANLSAILAILTIDQLKFSFSEDHYFGYRKGSFMKKFLIEKLSIKESRLRGFSTVEGFHDAMSSGSKNGGIDAIFDEIPYKIVGPTYRTDGLGFAFPIGCPLVAHFSMAILNVTQGRGINDIEQQNFGPGYSSQDPLSSVISQGTSSLTLHEFLGLFILTGSLILFALFCSETAIGRKITATTGRFGQNCFGFRTPRVHSMEGARVVGDTTDSGGDGIHELSQDNVNTPPPPSPDAQLMGNESLQDAEQTVETGLDNETSAAQDAGVGIENLGLRYP